MSLYHPSYHPSIHDGILFPLINLLDHPFVAIVTWHFLQLHDHDTPASSLASLGSTPSTLRLQLQLVRARAARPELSVLP